MSFEKLHKLKEKLLHSSPELNETNSDNESTPLVSEFSSCSPSEITKLSSSTSSSFPLSPLSQKSLSPVNKQELIRSEQNLTEITEISPTTSLQDALLFPVSSKDSGPNSIGSRSRTISESKDTYCMLGGSNVSSSQSLSHLSRQDALDSGDFLTDVYCDPRDKN